MIARLIDWCVHNRAMVVLLTLLLVVGGIWSIFHIKVDAIPDLSDVQVIIRTPYMGQAPEIVEDQVTFPLTTAMLAVPRSKAVRGLSMFGMSFVYIIFDDGTDMYWARSRVLERLSYVQPQLPAGVSPQLGPDATGVGWVYEYVLITGKYCPDHPNGLWHDPATDKWYADPADAPADPDVRARLVHHRVFVERPGVGDRVSGVGTDSGDREGPARKAAASGVRGVRVCPLDGKPLLNSDLDLSDLRGLQDWYLRYELTALDGVSEVASAGGFQKQYQVVVDPVKLLAYNIPLKDVMMALAKSNNDVGGRLIEISENEYMVRGLGYLGTLTEKQIADGRAAGKTIGRLRTEQVLDDLRKVSLGAMPDGAPIYLSGVAEVRVGPELRRGILDWNGQGETVGGIIVMRHGENARTTIEHVKAKLADLEKNLPPGVQVQVGYDRSDLIDRAVRTLSRTLLEEVTVVALICICFLLHARSELVAVTVVPAGVLASLALMQLLGINANLMSLGGIAIAIGVMVDSSIVMVENSHKHLDHEEERLHALRAAGQPAIPRNRTEIITEAAKEVGPSLFFALLVLTVSFLPVFVLGEQSGRMFKPLAYTKTFAMASSSVLAVTIIPVLMTFLITSRVLPEHWGRRVNLLVTLTAMFLPAALILWLPTPQAFAGFDPYRKWLALGWAILMGMLLVPQKIIHENANPLSWIMQGVYHPLFVLVMRFRWWTIGAAVALVLVTVWPLQHLGSEFMPPLEEGDLLYMPTTDPGISITKARELLQQTDRMIKQFPEVQTVLGKSGWAETATDPAGISMLETTITLHRDKRHWRHVPVRRFHSDWPAWAQWLPSKIWKDTRPITLEELVYGYDWPTGQHVPGLNETLQIPGLTNAWTMPIKTRIDMLSTGIKTPVGVKLMGPDLETLSDLAEQVAQVLKTAEGTGAYTVSAFAERTVGGNYLDIRIDRDQLARYGLNVDQIQEVINTAMGGMQATETVEGLERYSVNLRYPPELRDNVPALRQVLVATPSGAQVPLGQLTSFEIRKGPQEIRSENARRTSWVYVDIAGIDVGTYVRNAQAAVARSVTLPAGYSIVWSGQYEYMLAARQRLMVVVPLTLVLIVMLLYASMKSWPRVLLVLLAVPFSLVGAIWLLYLLGYNTSLAVWVGVIALAGLDAETGMVMLLYLDNSFERFRRQGRMRDADDLWLAVHDGAVKRIRPKTITVATAFIGLVPLLWASGAGADTMRRLAAPMIGGLTTSFLMELLVYPVIYYTAKHLVLRRQFRDHGARPDAVPQEA